ncbi:MAG: ABC transporter ATP-binding protein, partial [Planctomycetota bacterium]
MTTAPANPPILDAADIDAAYDKAPVLVRASLAVHAGDFLALCGPNGSGKSTLLRVMARLMKPAAGRVLLHDQPMPDLSRRALARKLAMMPQSPSTPPAVTVRELVGYGRAPHTSWLAAANAHDRDVIDRAIDTCDLHDLAHRTVDTLSGGERQRAW